MARRRADHRRRYWSAVHVSPRGHAQLVAGVMTPVECRTSAGGLATSRPGALALDVMNAYLETMTLVEEQQLGRRFSYAVHYKGVVIEAAAAAGVAALRAFARLCRAT